MSRMYHMLQGDGVAEFLTEGIMKTGKVSTINGRQFMCKKEQSIMPGYVMHLAEAGLILNQLEKERGQAYSQDWRNTFFLGTLLPDTKVGLEKYHTHFWKEEDIKKLPRAPHLSLFLKEYGAWLSEPLILGYLAHLHLDNRYVKKYWPSVFRLWDDAGEETEDNEAVTGVWITDQKRLVERSAFFSKEWFYGDYSALNAYLIRRYQVQIPIYTQDMVFPVSVKQVQERDLTGLLDKLQRYLQEEDGGLEPKLRVLEIAGLERFLEETAKEFVEMGYGRD